jgi:hypothetical protein
MTTEHEQPAGARAARDFLADRGFLDLDNAREVLRCLAQAREAVQTQNGVVLAGTRRIVALEAALAERDAEIANLKVSIRNMTAGLRQTRGEYEAEIDRLKTANRHEKEFVGKLHSQIARITAEKDTEIRNLSVEIARLNAPPSADAVEIARRHREEFERVCQGREWANQPDDDEWWGRAIEAAEARGRAERDTERTERDGICFREGVEFGRAQMGKPGTSALEATRDLFQSLEGWRPTDDWTGVPGRLKLAFDRTLHAIEVAEARGRAR